MLILKKCELFHNNKQGHFLPEVPAKIIRQVETLNIIFKRFKKYNDIKCICSLQYNHECSKITFGYIFNSCHAKKCSNYLPEVSPDIILI